MKLFEETQVTISKKIPNTSEIEKHATEYINNLLETLDSQYVVYDLYFDDYPDKVSLRLGCHGLEPDEDFDVDYALWHEGLKPLAVLYGAPVEEPYWYWGK